VDVRLNQFDLRLLQIFTVIVDCGGFSAAQVRLGMSQSTISGKMSDLETRLGVRLCQRGRSGFRLTPEGEAVYQETLRFLRRVDEYESRVGQLRGQINGHVDIGVVDTIAMNPLCRLPAALAGFRQRYPEVTLTLEVLATSDIEAGLLQGRLQLGLCSSDQERPGLLYLPLFRERQRLYAAPGHPVFCRTTPPCQRQDLLPYALAGRGQPDITPLDENDGYRTPVQSASMEGTALLLLAGELIGYLPEHFAAPWVASGALRCIDLPELDYYPAFTLTRLRYGTPAQATRLLEEAILAEHVAAAGD
jgi:DNA-binding transcriptional LysR family regulator